MAKVILIEVMLCVKWYRADLLKTWMSAPINFQSKLHWSSFFFYETEYVKSRSCKANVPNFSYITSPHIHWPSASHFQSREKSAKFKTVISCSCNKFVSICKHKISVLSISDFRLLCTLYSCYSKQPFTIRKKLRGIKDARDIKSRWLSEIRSLCLNCFLNCSWMCL